MDLFTASLARDLLIDIVLVCEAFGTEVNGTFFLSDPNSGFMATRAKTHVQVNAYMNTEERQGETLFLADLDTKPHLPEIKIFKKGPWMDAIKDTYEIFVRPTIGKGATNG
jgi:hypothetical protein